ncbi:hypothetical protein BC781_101223 [Sediminitomix flava]|uniref:DEAD/DEAH-box helicase domain-containing protein n=2 Tax=Sediminitomix flava TaxID=379075 RepID=A0A316A2F3_SEDFL|nr:hypothetical protein BC781_101223 [Sediminitomix flava]
MSQGFYSLHMKHNITKLQSATKIEAIVFDSEFYKNINIAGAYQFSSGDYKTFEGAIQIGQWVEYLASLDTMPFLVGHNVIVDVTTLMINYVHYKQGKTLTGEFINDFQLNPEAFKEFECNLSDLSTFFEQTRTKTGTRYRLKREFGFCANMTQPKAQQLARLLKYLQTEKTALHVFKKICSHAIEASGEGKRMMDNSGTFATLKHFADSIGQGYIDIPAFDKDVETEDERTTLLDYLKKDVLVTVEMFKKYTLPKLQGHEQLLLDQGKSYQLSTLLSINSVINKLFPTEANAVGVKVGSYSITDIKVPGTDLISADLKAFFEGSTAESIVQSMEAKMKFSTGKSDEFLYSIKGVEHKFKRGGLHAEEKGLFVSDDEWQIVDIDFGSFYPLLIANFIPMVFGKTSHFSTDILKQLIADRLDAKAKAKQAKKAGNIEEEEKWAQQAQLKKIVINSLFGLTNAEYSSLCVPKGNLMTCLTGQYFITALIYYVNSLLEGEMKLLQTNTDGITIMCKRGALDFEKFTSEAGKAYSIPLEITEYEMMHVINVNNYFAVESVGDDKRIKAKGIWQTKDPYRSQFPAPVLELIRENIQLSSEELELLLSSKAGLWTYSGTYPTLSQGSGRKFKYSNKSQNINATHTADDTLAKAETFLNAKVLNRLFDTQKPLNFDYKNLTPYQELVDANIITSTEFPLELIANYSGGQQKKIYNLKGMGYGIDEIHETYESNRSMYGYSLPVEEGKSVWLDFDCTHPDDLPKDLRKLFEKHFHVYSEENRAKGRMRVLATMPSPYHIEVKEIEEDMSEDVRQTLSITELPAQGVLCLSGYNTVQKKVLKLTKPNIKKLSPYFTFTPLDSTCPSSVKTTNSDAGTKIGSLLVGADLKGLKWSHNTETQRLYLILDDGTETVDMLSGRVYSKKHTAKQILDKGKVSVLGEYEYFKMHFHTETGDGYSSDIVHRISEETYLQVQQIVLQVKQALAKSALQVYANKTLEIKRQIQPDTTLEAPTGSGKTYASGSALLEWALRGEVSVLFVHSKETIHSVYKDMIRASIDALSSEYQVKIDPKSVQSTMAELGVIKFMATSDISMLENAKLVITTHAYLSESFLPKYVSRLNAFQSIIEHSIVDEEHLFNRYEVVQLEHAYEFNKLHNTFSICKSDDFKRLSAITDAEYAKLTHTIPSSEGESNEDEEQEEVKCHFTEQLSFCFQSFSYRDQTRDTFKPEVLTKFNDRLDRKYLFDECIELTPAEAWQGMTNDTQMLDVYSATWRHEGYEKFKQAYLQSMGSEDALYEEFYEILYNHISAGKVLFFKPFYYNKPVLDEETQEFKRGQLQRSIEKGNGLWHIALKKDSTLFDKSTRLSATPVPDREITRLETKVTSIDQLLINFKETGDHRTLLAPKNICQKSTECNDTLFICARKHMIEKVDGFNGYILSDVSDKLITAESVIEDVNHSGNLLTYINSSTALVGRNYNETLTLTLNISDLTESLVGCLEKGIQHPHKAKAGMLKQIIGRIMRSSDTTERMGGKIVKELVFEGMAQLRFRPELRLVLSEILESIKDTVGEDKILMRQNGRKILTEFSFELSSLHKEHNVALSDLRENLVGGYINQNDFEKRVKELQKTFEKKKKPITETYRKWISAYLPCNDFEKNEDCVLALLNEHNKK